MGRKGRERGSEERWKRRREGERERGSMEEKKD